MGFNELPSTVMLPPGVTSTFDLSPNQYVSGPASQVHTWPNFGENIYKDFVFTQFSESLTKSYNQHIYEPTTSVTKIGSNSKSPSLGCEIWCSQGFWVIA